MQRRLALSAIGLTTLVLSACSHLDSGPAPGSTSRPLACDDGLKAAFRPDALTTVVAVRAIAKGTPIVAVDSAQAVTTAVDMCLVKLLVGPGATAEKDKTARSYTQGIGIEVWLPAHAVWNQRIRNYGGGGWVGGGHRDPARIGSKVPAIVNANMGYASGTHDGGQPHYQDASFAFLSTGAFNAEAFADMSHRAIYEQATKTQALARLFYGQDARYRYYDGHSQGGRQGLKVAQERPDLYDGYLDRPAGDQRLAAGPGRPVCAGGDEGRAGHQRGRQACGRCICAQGGRRHGAGSGAMRPREARLSAGARGLQL